MNDIRRSGRGWRGGLLLAALVTALAGAAPGQEPRPELVFPWELPLAGRLLSPDGRLLVSTDGEHPVAFADLPPAELRRRLLESPATVARSVSAASRLLVTSTPPEGRPPVVDVEVWDLDAGERLWAREGSHSSSPRVFSPDGERLLVAGELRAARTGEVLHRLPLGEGEEVFAAEFSPDGERLVVSTYWPAERRRDARLLLLDGRAGGGLAQLQGHEGHWRVDLLFSPDGRLLLTTGALDSGANRVRLLDGRTGEPVRELPAYEGYRIVTPVFSSCGRWLAIVATSWYLSELFLWDLEADLLRWVQPVGETRWVGHTHLAGLAFSADGEVLLRVEAPAEARTLTALETRTGRPLEAWRPPEGLSGDLLLVPGAGLILNPTATGLLWDAATGELARRAAARPAGVTALAFSPDDTRVAAATQLLPSGVGTGVHLWDAGSGRLVRSVEARAPFAFAPERFHAGYAQGRIALRQRIAAGISYPPDERGCENRLTFPALTGRVPP